MKSIAAASALALLSSLSTASAQVQSPYFRLAAYHYTSSPAFNGIYLSSFHVGAGESTLVTTEDESSASIFSIQGGALVQNSSYPFVVSLPAEAPYQSDAPEGYNYVDLHIGSPESASKTFTYDAELKRVLYSGKDVTFAVCNVNGTAPYESVGPQSQLLWRSISTSKADPRDPAKCADVTLNAIVVEDTY